MLLGWEFVDTFDLVGVGTVVLALGTLLLAWWTRSAVRQGNVELERAHRPVLVPLIDVADKLEPRFSRGAATAANRPEPDRLYLPVRNIGMGPALRVVVTVEFGDDEGRPSTHGIESCCEVTEAGISHLAPSAVLVIKNPPLTKMTGFSATLDYEDVAGTGWRTTTRYSTTTKAFHDLDITERS